MNKIIIVLGIIATLSAVILHSNAVLKCYTCGPEIEGTDCYNGDLNEKHEMNCTIDTLGLTATKCVKGIIKHTNGTEYMIRSCDFTSGCDNSDTSESDYTTEECYNCDSDLCNSSEWNSANRITMCLTIFVSYLVMLK